MDLEDAVNELAPRLLRYCRGRMADPDAARDVAQHALTALVERWRKRGAPGSPEAFAFRIASRRAARYGRWWRRWISLDGVSERRVDGVSGSESRLRLRAVLSAIEKLSNKEKEALLLVVVGELSTEAAAATLGISPSAVKMRLSRARARLREIEDEC
jgi:RNA polymerase sigma-70 factor (ECF subfamily)